MKRKMKFNRNGLKAFSAVVLSCYPVHGELNADVRGHVERVIAGKEELDGNVMAEKLPSLVENIRQFAKKQTSDEITEADVFNFFSDGIHYQKVLRDLDEVSIIHQSIFSLRTIFAHLTIPVRIIEKSGDDLIGVFDLLGFSFLVKGLTAADSAWKIIQPKMQENSSYVLVHYAMVVDANPSGKLISDFERNAADMKIFLLACKYLQKHGGADYNKFPSKCHAKTQAILKKIDL